MTDATTPEQPRWEEWARRLAPLIHDGLIDTAQERQIIDKAFYLARLLDEHLPEAQARPADPAREFARWWLQQPKHIQHAFMRENGYVQAHPAVASEVRICRRYERDGTMLCHLHPNLADCPAVASELQEALAAALIQTGRLLVLRTNDDQVNDGIEEVVAALAANRDAHCPTCGAAR